MKKRLGVLLLGILLLSACVKQETDPGGIQDPEVPGTQTPAEEGEYFSDDEASAPFALSYEDAEALFGEVLNEVLVEDESGIDAVIIDYAEASIRWATGTVSVAQIRSNAVEHIRGVKIGDSLESVLSKFPNEGDGQVIYPEDDEEYGYQLIYGVDVSMTAYAMIEYWRDVPDKFVVSDADTSVIFGLTDGKVEYVTYR